MEYTEQTTKDGKVIIWTDIPQLGCRLGLRLTPGGRLELYNHALIYENQEAREKMFCTPEGMALVRATHPLLVDYATEHYPREFRPMPAPVESFND